MAFIIYLFKIIQMIHENKLLKNSDIPDEVSLLPTHSVSCLISVGPDHTRLYLATTQVDIPCLLSPSPGVGGLRQARQKGVGW